MAAADAMRSLSSVTWCPVSLPSLRERYERLHAIVLKEFEARGWDTHAGAELTQLSDLLSQAIEDEQQQPQPALPCSSQPLPTQTAAACEDTVLPAAADSDVGAAGDGFQAPETFVDDSDSSDGSEAEGGRDERSRGAAGSHSEQQPPCSPPPASPLPPLARLPPCPSTSPSQSPPCSSPPETPALSPAGCPPAAARGLTGRSVKRLQRLLSPSAALPSTPISDTLRRLRLDDSADIEAAEEQQPGEASDCQEQRDQLQEEEKEQADERQESSVQHADSELQPGMDGQQQAERPKPAFEEQAGGLSVQRLVEAVRDEDDSPLLTTRRARAKRIVDSDEDENSPCRPQPPSTPAAVRPLQDVTACVLNTPSAPSPFPAVFPAPKQRQPAVFATPAPRQPSSRVLTRSVSRSAGREQWSGRAGGTEAHQLSFLSTPVRDRIRQHREQLLSQRQPELLEEEEQGGGEEEAGDADAESEGELDWIVDDEDEEEEEGEEGEDEDGDHLGSPLPSPSPLRSPPSRSRAVYPSSSPSPARLTRSNRDALARQLFLSINTAAFDSLLPADLELCFSNRLLSTAGFCSLRLRGGERVASIQLAAKVVDDVRRLRLTLAHEMCHAAAWLVDGVSRPPHGRVFRRWAERCELRLQGVRVTTCHRYAVHYRWRYQCSSADCGRVIGRHTDSLDTEAAVCRCGHPLVKLGAFNRDGSACKVSSLSGFALFVQQRYAQVKREGAQHKDVMAALSRLYRSERRGDGQAAEAAEQPASQLVLDC